MMTRNEPGYDERERNALESLLVGSPLSEQRIQATLKRARRDVSFLRRNRKPVRVAAASLFVLLLSAGAWHWSGVDSERDLTLSSAIDVLRNPSSYLFVTREAAIGKVQRDIKNVLAQLKSEGHLTRVVRQGVLSSLDSPLREPTAYQGPFEALRGKAGSMSLSNLEQQQLLIAIDAGITAIRALGKFDPEHSPMVRSIMRRLRNQVSD